LEKSMAQSKRSTKLDSRTARKKVPAGSEKMTRIAPNQYIIYRKPKDSAAGRWFAQLYDPRTKKKTKQLIGTADDYHSGDGEIALSFSQAHTAACKWFERKIKELKKTSEIKAEKKVIDVTKYTVAEALEFLWSRKERHGEHIKGLVVDKLRANAWIIPDLGSIPLSELTKERIEVWLTKMAGSGRRISVKAGKPQAYGPPPKTDDEKRARKESANRVLAILKRALNEAYKENDNLANADEIRPCWQRVKPFSRTTKARPRFLREEEEIKLINACPPDFRELVTAALETGCRYGELARLRIKDYNPDSEIPTIYISDSKSGKPRYVDLGSERGIALFNELTTKKQSQDDFIFTHRITRRRRGDTERLKQAATDTWRSCDQKRLMKKACKNAGIEPIGFHGLRHSYASMLKRNGCLNWYIAKQLGHKDEKMIEDFYGHITPSDKAKAIQAAMTGRGRLDSNLT
jgi:integrase